MADLRDRDWLHKQLDTMMDQLLDLINLASTHSTDTDAINRKIADLKKAEGDLKATLDSVNTIGQVPQGKPLEMSNLSKALSVVNPASATGDRPDLNQFLRNVGTSLIRAQESLNEQSQEYSEAAALKFRGLVPPAQFLIPSLRGEMTVGINEVKSNTVNLIFIKDSETKSKYVTSKISFEMVASPPPPGASVMLTPFLLLQGRREFLDQLEQIPSVSSALNIANSKHFGAVFAVPKESTTEQKDESVFLVVYVVQNTNTPILDPTWKSLVLVAAQIVDKRIQLYSGLFEASDTNPMVFPKSTSSKVVSLGDALMQIVAAVYMWMKSLGIPPEVS